MDEIYTVSDLDLERYNCGEITGEEKHSIEAALAKDAALAAKLEALRRSDEEIRKTYTADFFDARRKGKRKVILFSTPFRWTAGAAAAILLMFTLPRTGPLVSGVTTDRAKGADELSIYLKTEGLEEKIGEHTVLREGSTVQLAYRVNGDRYGVIFSIDGRSVVTMHYPYTRRGDTKLVSGKRTALTEAYTLDDAPDCEIFFFVIADEPLETAEVLRMAERLAGDPASAVQKGREIFKNYDVKTITLAKE